MLPEIYLNADSRCALPFCPNRKRLGLAFDVPGQPTIRLALTPEHARFLQTCLNDYISSLAGNQSPGDGVPVYQPGQQGAALEAA